MPNLNKDDSCLGIDTCDKKTVETIIDIFNNADKEKLINFICDKFWLSIFGHHLQENIRCYKDKGKKIASLDYWQKQTKENPNWIPTSKDLVSLRTFYD